MQCVNYILTNLEVGGNYKFSLGYNFAHPPAQACSRQGIALNFSIRLTPPLPNSLVADYEPLGSSTGRQEEEVVEEKTYLSGTVEKGHWCPVARQMSTAN